MSKGVEEEYDRQDKPRIITQSDNDESSFPVVQTKHPQLCRIREKLME